VPHIVGRNGSQFMGHNLSNIHLQESRMGTFGLFRDELRLFLKRVPVGLWSRNWPVVLSALTILGLLLAFHQVVQGAVKQGQLRGQATAMHAGATLHCNTLPGLGARDSCMAQLKASARADTLSLAPAMAAEAPDD
jgi:hypothetical protein